MAQRAILIFNILLLISISAIEGDRNVNHRSLQSDNLQALQPVNFLGSYQSRDVPINHQGDKGKKKRRKRKSVKTGIKAFGQWDSSEYYDYNYESDETGTFRIQNLELSHFFDYVGCQIYWLFAGFQKTIEKQLAQFYEKMQILIL